MTIIFQSSLFDTFHKAHLACAEAWISANGVNDRDEILEALEESTDSELADDLNDAWEMDKLNWFNINKLRGAFAEIRENPAEIFGWDEDK